VVREAPEKGFPLIRVLILLPVEPVVVGVHLGLLDHLRVGYLVEVEVALPVLILWEILLLRTQQRGLDKALHLN
jgi:hypothetical protein